MDTTKTAIIICFTLALIGGTKAQQAAQTSLYYFNKYTITPAYVGLDDQIILDANIRQQWSGLIGAPKTQTITAHAPVGIIHGGIGLIIQNQTIGAHKQTAAKISYAYHQQINRNATLSIGISSGILSYTLLGDQLRTPDGNYENGVPDHQDNTLPTTTISQIAPVTDIGLYYQSPKFQTGIGIQHINTSTIKFDPMNFGNIGIKRNYFAIFAAEFELASSWKILPSLLCKTDMAQWQTDLSILTQRNDNIYFGLSFRGYNAQSIDALAFLGGVFINDQLFIQYAYDLPLSALRAVQTGSHEIGIKYRLNGSVGNGKLPGVIYNPRHL